VGHAPRNPTRNTGAWGTRQSRHCPLKNKFVMTNLFVGSRSGEEGRNCTAEVYERNGILWSCQAAKKKHKTRRLSQPP
jgi:hypothetical protein